jgi:hypothetical protein
MSDTVLDNRTVQCKNTNCIFNKKLYVPPTDTLQLCCNKQGRILRLDENGKCITGELDSVKVNKNE